MDNATGVPKLMSLHFLEEITDGFSKHRKLGGGAYGDVYLGEHKDGVKIAVKVLKDVLNLNDEQFEKEYRNLAILEHKNVVRLVGSCNETTEECVPYNGKMVFGEKARRMLCFEYLCNGSLETFIYGESNACNWHTRYGIIKGICEGLEYLHEKLKPGPMYHLDLKPANVLLDENMSPKIADFGVSRLFLEEKTRKTNSGLGTLGYIPPEYINEGLISIKFDIFSLGVLIIKIMAGREGYFRSAEMSPQQFVDLVHMDWMNRLQGPHAYSIQARRCIEIALRCVETDRRKRPSIGAIVSNLNQTEYRIQIFDALRNGSDHQMAVNLLSEIHSDSNQWTISVLVSRMWHYRGGTDDGPLRHTDVVLIDKEGNHMYGQLPPATSERLKDVLEEGKVFVIRKFMCTQSRPAFRPVESPFMVQFTRYTTVQEMPGLADTYPFCTYSLTSFADIPDPVIRPERFIDVIGKIEMVSDIVPVHSIHQTAASSTRTIILKDMLGNELRLVLWGERALEFDAEAVRAMGAKEPVIAIFVGTLPKMSHGVKGLSGSSACRWYIDEDIPDINLFRESIGSQFVPLAAYVPTGPGAIVPCVFEAPIEKTTQELNDADPFVDMDKKFLCVVTVDRLGADQRWWFASCSTCRKSSRHDGYQFQCSGKDCTSVDAALAYCISFFASDATGETEFVMFDKVAAGAVGKQLLPLMRQRYPGCTTVGQLAQAAKRDTAIPSEIECLLGQKYRLLVSISKRWNSGNSENLRYQVCRIEETYKPHLPPLTFLPSPAASSSSGGLGDRLPPLRPSQSRMQPASPALASNLSQVTWGATATPPPREPVTPAKGMSSTPKRGAMRSLFISPPKDKSQLHEDSSLAPDGDLILGEETVTDPLVEGAPHDPIAVDSDKANQTVILKTKRNASSTKSGGLGKKPKP